MKLDLAFHPTLDELAGLNDRLEDTLHDEGVHHERIGQVRLIVEELACNAISHGASAQPAAASALHLSLRMDPERLVLEFRDEGSPFDPRSGPAPALDAPVSERPIGGLGLFLIGQIADHIAYHREGAYNVVRITLLRPYSPAVESLP